MCTHAKMQVNMKTKMNIQYTQYYVLRFARKRDKIIQSRQVANYPITSNLQMSVQKNQTQLGCQKDTEMPQCFVCQRARPIVYHLGAIKELSTTTEFRIPNTNLYLVR